MSLAVEASSAEAAFGTLEGLFPHGTPALHRRAAFKVDGACSRLLAG